jgi:hypothetical protein
MRGFWERRGRSKERLEIAPDEDERLVMFEELSIHLGEMFFDDGVGRKLFAHLDKCTNHEHTHRHGALAPENIGGLQRAMFGEGEREKPRIAVSLGTGRNLRPVHLLLRPRRGTELYPFIGRQAEKEVLGKAPQVAFYSLIQALGWHVEELGKIGIEDDFLPAQGHNERFDWPGGLHGCELPFAPGIIQRCRPREVSASPALARPAP